MEKTNEILKDLYFNLNNASAFSGVDSLMREIKKRKLNIKLNEVKYWLAQQEEYTLHKSLKKKIKRNKVISYGIDDVWQADLVDMSKLSRANKGFKFLLTVIDVLSKKAWAIPLKNKSANSVLEAFKNIMSERKPDKIQTDKGKEFLNAQVKGYFKSLGVKLYTLNSELKACVVERFNRTLKEKMWRYFTHAKNKVYIEILPDLVNSYNNSHHRTINTTPNSVNKKNEKKIWEHVYGFKDEAIKIKYKTGDKVRIVKYKTLFEKGYTPNWTREIFVIYKILPRTPTSYVLKDLNNEIIEGSFYEQEIQKIEE